MRKLHPEKENVKRKAGHYLLSIKKPRKLMKEETSGIFIRIFK